METPQLSLLDMHIGEGAKVMAIISPKQTTDKLQQIGISVGVELQLLRAAPMGGPLLVKVCGREIAVGYELCSKIIVGVCN